MTKSDLRCPKCKKSKVFLIERIPEQPDKIIIKCRYTKKCGYKYTALKSHFGGLIE